MGKTELLKQIKKQENIHSIESYLNEQIEKKLFAQSDIEIYTLLEEVLKRAKSIQTVQLDIITDLYMVLVALCSQLKINLFDIIKPN